ncbi:MAG: hypothetical protein ACRD6X_06520 [Pyrinomonadaceae bacterium]
MLVPIDQLSESEARFEQESIAKTEDTGLDIAPPVLDRAAIGESFLDEALVEAVKSVEAPSLTVEENLGKRKEMLAEVGQEPIELPMNERSEETIRFTAISAN